MLQSAIPAPFPFPGSTGFVAGTCEPVTVLRRNDDGSCLVRVDAKPHRAPNRDASGNRTLEAGQLCETERAAFEAGQAPASSSAAVGRKAKPKRKAARART